MPLILCTQHLREVGPCEAEYFQGSTVRQALHAAGEAYPRLLGYVLDDQGEVRKHVAIFVRGSLCNRFTVLDEHVNERDEIHVLQALSGG